jgi:hypothetical protein
MNGATEAIRIGRDILDDGGKDLAVAGSYRAAMLYVRVHPLLLNAAKADEVRRKQRSGTPPIHYAAGSLCDYSRAYGV